MPSSPGHTRHTHEAPDTRPAACSPLDNWVSGCPSARRRAVHAGRPSAPIFPVGEPTPGRIATGHTCTTAAGSICKHLGNKALPLASSCPPKASPRPAWLLGASGRGRETGSSAPTLPGLACVALGKTLDLAVPPSDCLQESGRCRQPARAGAQRVAPPPPGQHHRRQK